MSTRKVLRLVYHSVRSEFDTSFSAMLNCNVRPLIRSGRLLVQPAGNLSGRTYETSSAHAVCSVGGTGTHRLHGIQSAENALSKECQFRGNSRPEIFRRLSTIADGQQFHHQHRL